MYPLKTISQFLTYKIFSVMHFKNISAPRAYQSWARFPLCPIGIVREAHKGLLTPRYYALKQLK